MNLNIKYRGGGYRNYLRCENIKAILDNSYKPDYRIDAYHLSNLRDIYNDYYFYRCIVCYNRLELFEGCYICRQCGYSKSV